MSGIVGILNLKGPPVSSEMLRQMTRSLAFRGPDAIEVWSEGRVGFGHAMLRTTRESANECQPFSLDRQTWITADARVDNRGELIGKLRREGGGVLEGVTDAELILRAYHLWGEACLEHLIGDFAFAIWDERLRRLFCARDHLGVKPFYYAQANDSFIFSNTINCVRTHPAVSSELNDRAVGDFLLFGFNQETSTTTFADIKRLPPAHYLICSDGVIRVSRYWTLPTDGHVRYKRACEYVDHFKELLKTAVQDRLRSDQVCVSMSGGLDSSSIAAVARDLLSERGDTSNIRACTIVYDRLIPDQERHYSALVAGSLNIPVQYLVADDYELYERWDRPELQYPEPTDFPLTAIIHDHLTAVAAHSRVDLSGEGGDPAFLFSWTNLADTFKRLQFGSLLAHLGQHVWSYGTLPRLGLRTMLKRLAGKHSRRQYPYPTWLNKEFTKEFDLPARLERINKEAPAVHPARPEAYNNYMSAAWLDCFERGDAGTTHVPVETRYPFFDLRIIEYLLAIPAMPWCANKKLLRAAMKNTLPDQVRLRPKTSLCGDPFRELVRLPQSRWLDSYEPSQDLARYVDKEQMPGLTSEEVSSESGLNSRPISLDLWLRNYKNVAAVTHMEEAYGTAR